MFLTHQVHNGKLRSVFFLLLLLVGRCCETQFIQLPCSKSFERQERDSNQGLPKDTKATQETTFPSCSCLLFSSSGFFMQICTRPFCLVPCGIFLGWSSYLDDCRVQKHTDTHTHRNPSPTLSEHPANRPCTMMHDNGMQRFDKERPQQSDDPLSRHERAGVINQQRLFIRLQSRLSDKDLKVCNCEVYFIQTSIISKTPLSFCQDLIFQMWLGI